MLEKLMNEMMILNRKAFIACKRVLVEHQRKAYKNKIEKSMKAFEKSVEKRNDVNCKAIPLLKWDDYPTPSCLNRFLRENFGSSYPRYIEVKREGYTLVLKLADITEGEGYSAPGMLGLNNGLGKIYNYREYVIEK